jgi:hypothetical protein
MQWFVPVAAAIALVGCSTPTKVSIGGACKASSDCGQGESCIVSAGTSVCEANLPDGGAPTGVGGTCASTGQCMVGASCIVSSGSLVCEPNLPDGGSATGVGGLCSSSGQCVSGSTCQSGICTTGNGNGDAGNIVGNGDAGNPTGDGGCVNLACQQVTCADGGTTSISGHVYVPNGSLPLYNAIVYVPNGTVQPMTDGVTCDVCGSNVTGNPLVITLTDSSGAFTLQNVPVGTNIPVVYQLGKWRRQVTIDTSSTTCQNLPLVNLDDQRLPASNSDGVNAHIPRIAFSTGGSDAMECLLAKIGVAHTEFGYGGQGSRIELYQDGLHPGFTSIVDAGGAAVTLPVASNLYGTDAGPNGLGQYDVVVMDCEGKEDWTHGQSNAKSQAAINNMNAYANAGGRIFATHYSYTWLANSDAGSLGAGLPNPPLANEFNPVATWALGGSYSPPSWQATVDQTIPNPDAGAAVSFPKGTSFYDWLWNVSALMLPDAGVLTAAEFDAGMGTLTISPDRYDVTSVNPQYATEWLHGANIDGVAGRVGHMTFNTPINPISAGDGGTYQCGRVVFSDFHVSSATGATFSAGTCGVKNDGGVTLTDDEKALVFMLFDVSSCVQNDAQQPSVCPGVGQTCSTSNPCCSGLPCSVTDGGPGVCQAPIPT